MDCSSTTILIYMPRYRSGMSFKQRCHTCGGLINDGDFVRAESLAKVYHCFPDWGYNKDLLDCLDIEAMQTGECVVTNDIGVFYQGEICDLELVRCLQNSLGARQLGFAMNHYGTGLKIVDLEGLMRQPRI